MPTVSLDTMAPPLGFAQSFADQRSSDQSSLFASFLSQQVDNTPVVAAHDLQPPAAVASVGAHRSLSLPIL